MTKIPIAESLRNAVRFRDCHFFLNTHKLLACTAVSWIGLLMMDAAMASDKPTVSDEPAAAEVSGFVSPDDGYDWLQLVSGE